ncbi:MAG TPA: nicotinamide mononucleotide transporter family protein, partial [Pseudomonadales bacterium]|nr:nicotinamide mononucleotide transporter family protein [Pseudomonadales bacterium]
RGGKEAKVLPIQRLAWQYHGTIFVAIAVLTVGSGYWLTHNTQAALPYLDSFTTWGAVITTVLVARKVLENWLYWIVIDSAALYLYIQRDLYLTAALMAVYLIMIVLGWLQWQADYKAQQNAKPTAATA